MIYTFDLIEITIINCKLFLILDMPQVSYYRELVMHLLKYIMMLADVDDLEMTVASST